MSTARLRMWIQGAVATELPPEKIKEVCDRFLTLAANEAGGERVYIPSGRDGLMLGEIERMRELGMSLRQIGESLGISYETVRARLSRIPSYNIDS